MTPLPHTGSVPPVPQDSATDLNGGGEPPAGLEPLPEDVVLLHIGPRKTGTTALQSAFADGRAEARSFQVLYPGRRRSQFRALGQMIGRSPEYKGGRLSRRLAKRVSEWPARAFVSGEVLEYTRPDQITALVEQLGADRVQILITARPLAKTLPSLWQQQVKGGAPTPALADWTAQLLADDNADEWFGQRIDRLAERWGDALGDERINVLLIDPDRPRQLVPTIERLMGIPEHTLTVARSNRGMTSLEADLVRGLHQIATENGVDPKGRKALKRAVDRMLAARAPDPDENKPRLNLTQAQPVLNLQDTMTARLESRGFRIIGNPAIWGRDTGDGFAETGPAAGTTDRDAPWQGTRDSSSGVAELLPQLLDAYTGQLKAVATPNRTRTAPTRPAASADPESTASRTRRIARRFRGTHAGGG